MRFGSGRSDARPPENGGGSPFNRDLLVALMATTTSSLPIFLVGTLAVQIRAELHFSKSLLGLVITLSYLGAASWSIPSGRVAESVGGVRVLRWAPLVGATLLILLGTVTRSWAAFALLLFPCGMVSASIATGSNLFLAKRTAPSRQGVTFGIKQAAVPFSSLIGGLAVPAVALTVGWRWAFVGGAALAVVTSFLVPRPETSLSDRRRSRVNGVAPVLNRGALLILGSGLGLGVFAASGMAAFLVTDAVSIGVSHANAGFLAAVAGAAAVVARIVTGIVADRRGGGHFRVVAAMMIVGMFSYAVLALGATTGIKWIFVIGSVSALGIGWGWNGLFNFATIRSHSQAPARATGLTQVGGRLGGMMGPLVIGFVADKSSFGIAWTVCALLMGVAAISVTVGQKMLLSRDVDATAGQT